MDLLTLQNIITTIDSEDTSMRQAFQDAIKTKTPVTKKYIPDSADMLKEWFDENFDVLKAFVPFKSWNHEVLDKVWLKQHRNEIDIRFATGGVFIKMDDLRRYLDHSLSELYTEEELKVYRDKYYDSKAETSVAIPFGHLSEDSEYVKNFKDEQVRLSSSFSLLMPKPVCLVDRGSDYTMRFLQSLRHKVSYDAIKDKALNGTLWQMRLKDDTIIDVADKVYKLSAGNYIVVNLLGDISEKQYMLEQRRRKEFYEVMNQRDNSK